MGENDTIQEHIEDTLRGGCFLDPANPEVQRFLLTMLSDLAAYEGLDGIVMDVVAGVGLIAKGKFHSNLISAFAVPCLINMLIIGRVVLVVGFLIYACGRKICDGVARKKQNKAQANA